jgi:hypothetical protein
VFCDPLKFFLISSKTEGENMEIELETRSLNPKMWDHKPTAFRIYTDETESDSLDEIDKGTYKQYDLFLYDGVERVKISYLFKQQLKDLIKNYGKDTKKWVNRSVIITSIQKENGYYDWILKADPLTEFVHHD